MSCKPHTAKMSCKHCDFENGKHDPYEICNKYAVANYFNCVVCITMDGHHQHDCSSRLRQKPSHVLRCPTCGHDDYGHSPSCNRHPKNTPQY